MKRQSKEVRRWFGRISGLAVYTDGGFFPMRKLESYVRKYGAEVGARMYRNLQREAALASAHARLMKRLRQGQP
jgi:hypothetical protein